MSKRLVLDLERCYDCGSCSVECAYFYRAHAADHGVTSLKEQATLAVVCRRCEAPSCVEACRFNALERQDDGILKRHSMRCVSCKCCVHACPFGTLLEDLVPFYVTRCDHCASSVDGEPPCVKGCKEGSIAYREVAPDEEGAHLVGEHLAVQAPAWVKREPVS